MKTRILLPLLFITLFFSCKKNTEPGIEYNVLTEQRILEISDQATISDEDIATLERLNANVTDNSLKAKYTEMIEGVKIIKDFIPAFNQLRIDPDLIFQDVYAELEEQLKQVTDHLPRKAKLQTDLETALANYNTEEVEFLEVVLSQGQGLTHFLATNYDIQPVEGKPNRYLGRDIESVDSLAINFFAPWAEQGMLPQVLRHFRGLRYLYTFTDKEPVLDFNHLSNLETLSFRKGGEFNELKIDQLSHLKHLEIISLGRRNPIIGSPFGTVLDFTDKFPLLETLSLPQELYEPLTELILPEKEHLTSLSFTGGPLVGGNGLPNIKRLVIEGKTVASNLQLRLGSATNKEIDEVRLSGIGTLASTNNGLYLRSPENQVVKIKKLSLSDMAGNLSLTDLDIDQIDFDELSGLSKLSFGMPDGVEGGGVNFAQKPDFSSLKLQQAEEITFVDNTYGGNTKFSWEDISLIFTGKPNPETLKTINLGGVTNLPTQEYLEGLFPNLEIYNRR